MGHKEFVDFERGSEVLVGGRVGIVTEQFNSLSIGVVFAAQVPSVPEWVDPADKGFDEEPTLLESKVDTPKSPFYWTVVPWRACKSSRTLGFKEITARLDWYDCTPAERKGL